MLARKVSAAGAHGTLRAPGVGAFAQLLSVTLQEQIGARAGIQIRGGLALDGLLRLAVSNAVILTLLSLADAHQHVRAVGWHGGKRRNAGKQKDAVGARIGNVGELAE